MCGYRYSYHLAVAAALLLAPLFAACSSDGADGPTSEACETPYEDAGAGASNGGAGGLADGGTGADGPAPAGNADISSDDFSAGLLNTQIWEIIDVEGDGTVEIVGTGSSDAQLHLSVPAGTPHDPWVPANKSLRVMQQVEDGDFEVEVKFESLPTEKFQAQGILVARDATNFLRFDVFSDGSTTFIFSATIINGSDKKRVTTAIEVKDAVFLRLSRSGDDWTGRYSIDGKSWPTAVTFSQEIEVASVGVFVSNAGPSPAFTAVVDYFFDTSKPIVPEDEIPCEAGEKFEIEATSEGPGNVVLEPKKASYKCGEVVTITAEPETGAAFSGWSGSLNGTTNPATLWVSADSVLKATFEPDMQPPMLDEIAVQANAMTADVTWATNEASTGSVEYGLTTAYELGSVETTARGTMHSVTLAGLMPETSYHYRITASDDTGNTASSEDGTFETTVAGPEITFWYGDSQSFGVLGQPQRWINVLGHVEDPNKVKWANYSLNGAPEKNLGIRAARRIAAAGDFNVELDFDELQAGSNSVTVRAQNELGLESTKTVIIEYTPGNTWPLEYQVEWSSAKSIGEVAQVVDGLWSISDGALKNETLSYDRAVALGDITWKDYEVTVPVTIHQLSAEGFAGSNFRPAVGFMLKWPGHSRGTDNAQPNSGWTPTGGGPWYEYLDPAGETGEFHLTDFLELKYQNKKRALTIPFNTPYVFKARVNTMGAGAEYRVKAWEQALPEPMDWDFVATDPEDTPGGGLLLVAHYLAVSFGDVMVTPAPTEAAAFVINADGWYR